MNKSKKRAPLKVLHFVRFQRYQLINAIYFQELQNAPLTPKDIQRLLIKTKKTKELLVELLHNYQKLKQQICHFLEQGYEWEFNFPLLRGILIVGAFLLYKIDAGIVINELVDFTKLYVPGNYYRFINKVLDSLAKQHTFPKKQTLSTKSLP